MATLPDKIECVVSENGNPVMGLMLRAEFKTIRKNPYSIIFGPTNRDGGACLNRVAINQQAESQLNLALMDFDPLDKAFTGIVRIAVMQEPDVQNALRAYEIFQNAVTFADHYEENLKSSLKVLRHTNAQKITVGAKVEPTSVTVLFA